MIDLKARYGSVYRITLDESAELTGQTKAERLWLYRIVCKRGHIYVHGKNTLGAFCDRKLIGRKLALLEGVTVHQRGDVEIAVTFDPAILPQVAELLQPIKRRKTSPEDRAKRIEVLSRVNAAKAKARDTDAVFDP